MFRRISVFIIILTIIFFLPSSSFAARNAAGAGNQTSEFDFDRWATNNAVGMGSMMIGGAIASGINGAAGLGTSSSGLSGFSQGIQNGISGMSSLSGWASNFNQSAALSQVNRAVSGAGQYHEWETSTTAFVNSVVGGMASGGINPARFGSSVSGNFNGIALGALDGAVEGAIISSQIDDEGNVEPWVGPVAGLAGGMASGMVVNGFTSGTKYDQLGYGVKLDPGKFSFANDYNLKQAISGTAQDTLKDLATTSVKIAIKTIKHNSDLDKSENRHKSDLIDQGLSGLWVIGNAGLNYPKAKKIADYNAEIKSRNGGSLPLAPAPTIKDYTGNGGVNSPSFNNIPNATISPNISTPNLDLRNFQYNPSSTDRNR